MVVKIEIQIFHIDILNMDIALNNIPYTIQIIKMYSRDRIEGKCVTVSKT